MDTLDYIVISIGVLLFIGLCVYIYIVLIAASTPNSTPNSTTNSTTLPDNSTNTISKDNQTPVQSSLFAPSISSQSSTQPSIQSQQPDVQATLQQQIMSGVTTTTNTATTNANTAVSNATSDTILQPLQPPQPPQPQQVIQPQILIKGNTLSSKKYIQSPSGKYILYLSQSGELQVMLQADLHAKKTWTGTIYSAGIGNSLSDGNVLHLTSIDTVISNNGQSVGSLNGDGTFNIKIGLISYSGLQIQDQLYGYSDIDQSMFVLKTNTNSILWSSNSQGLSVGPYTLTVTDTNVSISTKIRIIWQLLGQYELNGINSINVDDNGKAHIKDASQKDLAVFDQLDHDMIAPGQSLLPGQYIKDKDQQVILNMNKDGFTTLQFGFGSNATIIRQLNNVQSQSLDVNVTGDIQSLNNQKNQAVYSSQIVAPQYTQFRLKLQYQRLMVVDSQLKEIPHYDIFGLPVSDTLYFSGTTLFNTVPSILLKAPKMEYYLIFSYLGNYQIVDRMQNNNNVIWSSDKPNQVPSPNIWTGLNQDGIIGIYDGINQLNQPFAQRSVTNAKLTLQDDRNLVLYDLSLQRNVIWASNTVK